MRFNLSLTTINRVMNFFTASLNIGGWKSRFSSCFFTFFINSSPFLFDNQLIR